MVETLVFEAPTPLPEHSEREFNFPDSTNGSSSSANGANPNDDSGIELQEEWVEFHEEMIFIEWKFIPK